MADATLQPRIIKRFIVLLILLLTATLFAELATQHWIFELFTHFKPHYAVAALLIAVPLALLGGWRWMMGAFALALWNGYPVADALLHREPVAKTAAAPRQFTVFHFNVGQLHDQPSRIISHLQRRAKDIDVVVLLEATHDFDVVLDDIKDLFPYQIKHLEDSPFGIALASKQPIDFGAVSLIPSEHFPHIEATLKLPGRAQPLALYAIHAPPPISSELAAARNAKFEQIARQATAQAQSTPVVVGDFNVTPWSPYFRRFAQNSGLRDARTPGRFDHTWPVTFNNAHIGLAIDHTFAHPSLRLIKRTIGPDLGSDHLPVTATFAY